MSCRLRHAMDECITRLAVVEYGAILSCMFAPQSVSHGHWDPMLEILVLSFQLGTAFPLFGQHHPLDRSAIHWYLAVHVDMNMRQGVS